jgi:2-polyprenyl-3-methyl-5-hydroxy-6-metoxy-1,4-benzoquinol methylase
MEQKNYKNKFTFIQQSLDGGEYDVVIKESATLFEVAMKKIFTQAITKLPFAERKELTNAEDEIGKGNKGVDDFTFGQLVGLYRQSKLFKKWETISDVDLGILTSLDLGSIVEMRNKLTHQGGSCNKFEAELVFNYLKNFFASLGLADIQEAVGKVIEQTKIPTKENKPTDEFDIRLLKKTSKKASSYSPVEYNELDRLRKQSQLREEADLNGLQYGLSLMNQKEDLVGLDIGCSEGFVTHERFSKLNGFSHVIGIDQSKDAIDKANSANYKNYSFYNIDIETKEGIQLLKDKLLDLGKSGFDVIFSSAVFHHLTNPTKVLRELRKIMNKNGVIIIRTLDDQLTLSYPDEDNIVEKIFTLSEQIPGMSNRKHGRQIYNQLWKTGFRNQKIFLGMLDTSGKDIDERMNVYQNNFQWRPNYIKRAIIKYPEQKIKLEKDLQWMEAALERLEEMFEAEDFFLMEPVMVAVGQKL